MPLPFSLIFHLIPPLLLLLLRVSLSHALPVPDPAPIQLHPAASASTSSVAAATIPAFPEQSDVASSACPLDLPADLLPSVIAACASGSGPLLVPSRPRCCPALAAWLYAAFSPTALAARPLPDTGYDLPALPDDSEACAASAERSVRARGFELPRKNSTCDAAYCYCGVRLRRLACAGGFVADPAEGRWVPAGGGARRLEEDCAGAGLTGCSRCLRSLNQLKANSSRSSAGIDGRGVRECQLMGVTWLLYRNRTLYLPTATAVLRALMAADDTGSPDPSYCSLSQDAMPLAVGSNEIDVHETSSSAALSTLFHLPLPLLLCIIFLL